MSDEVIEELAALEHDQWVAWSKEIAKTEPISLRRLARWKKFWVPYAELPDDVKEFDRIWARKVHEILTREVEKEAQAVSDLYPYGE